MSNQTVLQTMGIDIAKFCSDMHELLDIDPAAIVHEEPKVEPESEFVKNFNYCKSKLKKLFDLEDDGSVVIEKNEDTREIVMNIKHDDENVEPVKAETVQEEVIHEAKLKPIEEVETIDKITMSERKVCPVKVVPTKKVNTIKVQVKPNSPISKIKVNSTNTKTDEAMVDETLEQFKNELISRGYKFTDIRRAETGLVEVNLIQPSGNTVMITVDINSIIYNNGVVIFFMGQINPGDEYTVPGFLFTPQSITAVINGDKISPKDYVPEQFAILNRILDYRSLKEKNPKKRDDILRKAARALAELNDDIVKVADGSPFRFNFTKCKSKDDFIMIASSRNVVSNLSKERVNTTKHIEVVVNGKKATMNLK